MGIQKALQIPWTDPVRNEESLRKFNKEKYLITNIKKTDTVYLGQVQRDSRAEILKLIIEEKIEGKRGRLKIEDIRLVKVTYNNFSCRRRHHFTENVVNRNTATGRWYYKKRMKASELMLILNIIF